MKKFSKILVIALSFMVVLSAFAFAASAQSSPFLVEGLSRNNWEEAIDNAYIEGGKIVPVELLADYTVADGESVEINKSVVIALNGHTLSSETGEALFTVTGADTTVTIVGPGKISVNGTLAVVDGATLVLDATNGMTVTSTGEGNAFVIGGEEKAYAKVVGSLSYVNKTAANLFEVTSASEFVIENGSSITAAPDLADGPSGIIMAGANSKITVKNASLTNKGGYIFGISEDTDSENIATIKCENAVLVSESSSYGSILEAGYGYADVSIRLSEILASGGAFSAADNITEYEGEGREKVYAKPGATVSLTASTYTASQSPSSDNASLFFGNITGVVSSSYLYPTSTSAIGIGTRIWDGECGIILKAGTKTSALIESETVSSTKDEDGTVIYFNPESETNKNFSLDTINGEACKLLKASGLTNEHSPESYYVVATSVPNFIIDTRYSSNFENAAIARYEYNNSQGSIASPALSARITTNYGYVAIEEMSNEKGETNRFYKFLYDDSKKEQYPFGEAGQIYLELDTGNAGPDVSRPYATGALNDFITIDFDIATENGRYPDVTGQLMSREGTSNLSYWAGTFYISNNVLTIGNATFDLPTAAYEWTHLTMLYEIDNSSPTLLEDGKTIVYPNMYKSKVHLYINGNYLASAAAYTEKLGTDLHITPKMAFDAIRFILPGNEAMKKNSYSCSICFDNLVCTYYPAGYEGDINKICLDKTLNLKSASDVVFKTGYQFPLTEATEKPVAIVDGVDYFDISSALEAISEGSIVEIFQDVEGNYNADSSFTLYNKKPEGGNYKFNIVSETHYVSSVYENGELVGMRLLPANKFVTVYWQINMVYENKVPVGIIPVYDGVLPSGYDNGMGQWIELIGWSETQGATEPQSLDKITKEDLAKGYKILYPVYGVTKVKVTYVDENSAPIGSPIWLPVGTPASELSKYNDGSSFPIVPATSWYDTTFGHWEFADGSEILGMEAMTVVPKFTGAIAKEIKHSYSIVRLTSFSPNIYVRQPSEFPEIEFCGFSETGSFADIIVGAGSVVSIDGVNYYHFDGAAYSNTYDFIRDLNIYIHFKFNGREVSQAVSVNVEAYLEQTMENASTDIAKSAVMETMRLIDSYLKLAGKPSSPVCDKYLNDKNYAKYLSDISSAIDLIPDEKKAAVNKQLFGDGTKEGIYDHFEKNIKWDFVTNNLYMTPLMSAHPTLTNGASNTYLGDFLRVDAAVNRIPTYLEGRTYKLSINYNGGYGVKMMGAIKDDNIVFYFQGGGLNPDGKTWKRDMMIVGDMGNGNGRRVYNLSTHIIELDRRIGEGEDGLAAEYKMAQTIYVAHYVLTQASAGTTAAVGVLPLPLTPVK